MRVKLRKWLLKNPRYNPYKQTKMGKTRSLTRFLRTLPSFMIIGAGKSGTTSLFNYLIQHPKIEPGVYKEIHYFDYNYGAGFQWYKAHFPIKSKDKITLDATPSYLDSIVAPKRVHDTLPKVKLIVILRNPIDRAYSQYNHTKRNCDENLTFEEAIDEESRRLEGEKERIIQDPTYTAINYNKYSYLSRSLYYLHLNEWFKYFPREQFFIFEYKNLTTIFNQIFNFIGVDNYKVNTQQNHNVSKYETMKPQTRKKLTEYFQPYNEKLYKLLGINYNWS